MKQIHKIILGVTGLLALISVGLNYSPNMALGATPALTGGQGGTGINIAVAGDVGKFLKVITNSPLTYGFDSVAGGSQTPWAGNINGATYSLSNVGSLSATSSLITQATSTNFAITGVLSSLLKTNAGGSVVGATAGVDYESPLTFNYPLSRSVNTVSFPATSTLYVNFNNGGLGVDTLGQVYKYATTTYTGTAPVSLAYLNGVVTGSMAAATRSVDGYLSGAQFTIFDNKVGSSSLSGTAPINYVGATGVISCTTASAGVAGCLNSTDWSTFNGKSGFSYPFPNNATTSNLSFGGASFTSATATSIVTTASSTIQNLNSASSTITTELVTNGTTTNFFASFASTTNLSMTNVNGAGLVACTGANHLQWSSSKFSCAADAATATGANPTGTIGLTAVNGSASTFMRSDGAPALGVTITPTWTGLHIFNTGGLISNASSSIQNFNSASSTLGTLLVTGNATGTNAHFSTSILSALGNFTKLFATNATTTNLAVTNTLTLPYNNPPTISINGDIGVDSTTDQLRYMANSTTTSLISYQKAWAGYSTSTTWAGTTTVQGTVAFEAQTFTQAQCYTNVGTVGVSISDGTNKMDYFVASTTAGRFNLTTNNRFDVGEKRYIDFGTPATSPTNVTCVFKVKTIAD